MSQHLCPQQSCKAIPERRQDTVAHVGCHSPRSSSRQSPAQGRAAGSASRQEKRLCDGQVRSSKEKAHKRVLNAGHRERFESVLFTVSRVPPTQRDFEQLLRVAAHSGLHHHLVLSIVSSFTQLRFCRLCRSATSISPAPSPSHDSPLQALSCLLFAHLLAP